MNSLVSTSNYNFKYCFINNLIPLCIVLYEEKKTTLWGKSSDNCISLIKLIKSCCCKSYYLPRIPRISLLFLKLFPQSYSYKLIRITRNPPAVSQYANFVLWILNADFVVKTIFGSTTRTDFLLRQLWIVNYYVKSCQIISGRDHSSITSACFWLF